MKQAELRKIKSAINEAVSDLKNKHEKITISKVSKLTGISYQKIYQSKLLDQYVNKLAKPEPVIEKREVVEKITLANNLVAYTNHIIANYFQEPQSMYEVLIGLNETVEGFNENQGHLIFRDVVKALTDSKRIVRVGDKWVATEVRQTNQDQVYFYLPLDGLGGERSFRVAFPSDLGEGEKAKIRSLLQSVSKLVV